MSVSREVTLYLIKLIFISNFALTKSRVVLRVSYFQLLPIPITPKFDVFSLTFALRLYLCSVTHGIGKNKPLDARASIYPKKWGGGGRTPN